MKKNILTLALLAATVAAGAQSTVNLSVANLPDGTVIEAALGSTHQTEPALATATLVGGKATLTLPIDEPRMVDFTVKGTPGTLLHLMTTSGENVTASVEAERHASEQGDYYSSKNQQVYNSPLHAQYMMKLGAFREYLNVYNTAYHDAYRDINEQMTAAFNAQDTARQTQLRLSQAWREFTAADASFFRMLETEYPKRFAENDSTWWGPFMRLDTYTYFTAERKPEYDRLPEAVKASFYGQALKEQVAPKGFQGESYTQFNVVDDKGKSTPSARLTKGKRYMLIDFWASWCAPCRKEIPNLKSCYADFKGKGLEIISVSIDRSDAAWKKALAEEQLPWPNGIDREGIADAYKVRAIPAMFLVDVKTGKIVGENLRGTKLRDKLAELMP